MFRRDRDVTYQLGRIRTTSARRWGTSLRRHWRALLVVAIILLCPVLVVTQANSSGGAAAADLLRSSIGANRTAQVESLYLNAVDSWQQLQYRAGVSKAQAPWTIPPTPAPSRAVASAGITRRLGTSSKRSFFPVRQRVVRRVPVLLRLHTLVSPVLPGEGVWTASVAPASKSDPLPLIAKAFVRPDPSRPYAIATLLRFDLRYVAMHLVPGTTEPGGPVNMEGTGSIPLAAQQPGTLLAAFNGGFKYADGAYGMMVKRTVYVNPVADAATIAITSRGRLLMGAWGRDQRLRLANHNLVSWRQNGSLLIDRGVINPLAADGGAWGTTVLNDVHTWRSAIGLAPDHTLLYVAGNALSVSTLALALKEAGARTAMEMDINPFWVRAFFYGRDPAHHLTMAKLRPDMAGIGTEFLGGYARDFMYVTRIPGRSQP